MARPGVIGLLAVGLLGALGVVVAARESVPVCRGTLVPAYVRPDTLAALPPAGGSDRLVVMNPASGPGTRAEPGWRGAVEAVRRDGSRVLGYVPVAWGARDAAAVQQDVERSLRWYGVDGIFLDEAPAGKDRLESTRATVRAARRAGAQIIVLNPGVVPAAEYLDLADVVVTYEGTGDGYAAALDRMPDWVQRLPAERTAHLLYDTSREQARKAVAAGGRARLYSTPGALPNPWGEVSPYLREQESLLAGERCPGGDEGLAG
jgi:hypothetical protein